MCGSNFSQSYGRKEVKPRDEIRKVDFANFRYPWPPELRGKERHFTLQNGEVPMIRDKRGHLANIPAKLVSTKYADVTGDGSEEAIVFVSLTTGGSAIPGILYLYSLHRGRPSPILVKSTGDRADGGYRNAYEEAGKLVVELSNPDGSRGDCCPAKYDRLVYAWHLGDLKVVERRTLPIK